MTPPDTPEQAPSALSRLERALAGFGDRESQSEPQPEVVDDEPEAIDDPEPDQVEDEEPVEDEESVEDERWAPPSRSVLDIAAAVAAVERLSGTEEGAEEDLLSDSDAVVLAATAAGTARPSEADAADAEDDEGLRFEPADLRGRVYEFSDEDDEGEPEPEPEEEKEEPLVDEEPAPEHEPEEDEAPASSWERNVGDATLPYFLVEENLPIAADPVSEVEELREVIVRPLADTETEPKQPASIARTLAEIPVLLIVAALIAFLVKTFLAQAYYIPSGSMLPQLQIDDRVVVSKLAYKAHDPRRGDIVVFDDPRTGAAAANTDDGLLRKVGEGIGIVQPSTDEFIKRVIGLPGETVEGKNGHVYINGQRLIEPYLKDTVVTSDFEAQTVKTGRLWVMGDNRTGSADSRVFGQIKIDTIVGRALVKVWPLDHVSFL